MKDAALHVLRTSRMLAALLFQARFTFRPRGQIEALRDARLRNIVAHAYKTVPHYRQTMQSLGVGPADSVATADLPRLPEIGSADLKINGASLFSSAYRPENCPAAVSGGTTGIQKSCHHDPLSFLMNVAWSERQESIFRQYEQRGRRARQLLFVTRSAVSNTIRESYRQQLAWLRWAGPTRLTVDIDLPFEDQIAAINRFRPDRIIGYGGFLGYFCGRVAREGTRWHAPRVIAVGADMLDPRHRRQIENELRIPVIQTYQSSEALKIGFECEQRNGYHLHEDLCHVRLLDDDGRDVPEGLEGRVFITNLVNRATVLINYDQGDRGRFLNGPCPCGRNLRRLELMEGRRWILLRTPDGRRIHFGDFASAVRNGEKSIERVQVVVESPVRWRINIVDPVHARNSDWRSACAARLKESLNIQGIELAFEQRDRLEATPSGKMPPVIVRCAAKSWYDGN